MQNKFKTAVVWTEPRWWNSRHWRYCIYISNSAKVTEAERWCYDNITHARMWRNYGQHFAFKNQQHSMLFAILWA